MRTLVWTALLIAVSLAQSVGAQNPQPETDTALVALGNRYIEQGDFGAAKDVFASVLENGSRLQGSLGLARAAIAEEAWSDAADRLEDALEAAPDDVEARYLHGITQRELAKFRTLNQAHHWNAAERAFELVLARDSTYRDVLYQYALLRSYHGDYAEAIRLGHLQHRLKPDLVEPHTGLFAIYRQFIHQAEPDRAAAYLDSLDTPYAAYFKGELLRRQGRTEEADAIFRSLLENAGGLPAQPLLLSRARVLYEADAPREAEALFEEAVERIADEEDAAFVFRDVKYVLTEDELELYDTLAAPDEFKAFFQSLWARRDPMPARPVNVRLQEHYRRLLVAEAEYIYDGFRLWHSDPDKLGHLEFPETYTLNEEFNDKGLIYIRHGEPADREIQVGDHMDFRTVPADADPFYAPGEHSYQSGWLPNESWRYETPEQMDFHFVLAEGGEANNWRLSPVLTNYQMLQAREHWGPRYFQMAQAAQIMAGIQDEKVVEPDPSRRGVAAFDEELTEEEVDELTAAGGSRQVDLGLLDNHTRSFLEFQDMRGRMIEESRRDLQLALSTDRHTWQDEVETLEMPYVISAFRGNDGRTEVEVDFALPIGQITEASGATSTVAVEVGYAVHDGAWQTVRESLEEKRLPTSPDASAAVIDFFRFDVEPAVYNVSLYSSPLQSVHLAGYKFEYEAPDFSGNELAMSDLQMADFVGPARSGSRFDRGSVHVSPNPFLRYSTEQPVYFYFELYNLTLNADDETDFEIEYILKPDEPRKKFLGLFGGGDDPAVAITEERSGTNRFPVEHAAIDVSTLDPGAYTLTIRVRDMVTGLSVERSRPIELYLYD